MREKMGEEEEEEEFFNFFFLRLIKLGDNKKCDENEKIKIMLLWF